MAWVTPLDDIEVDVEKRVREMDVAEYLGSLREAWV